MSCFSFLFVIIFFKQLIFKARKKYLSLTFVIYNMENKTRIPVMSFYLAYGLFFKTQYAFEIGIKNVRHVNLTFTILTFNETCCNY